jgi:hypothetical protein
MLKRIDAFPAEFFAFSGGSINDQIIVRGPDHVNRHFPPAV